MKWHRDELILILDLYLNREAEQRIPRGMLIDSLASQLKQISPLLGRRKLFEQIRKTSIQDVLNDLWRTDPNSSANDRARRKLSALPRKEEALIREIWEEFGDNPALCHEVAAAILVNAVAALSETDFTTKSIEATPTITSKEETEEEFDFVVEAEEGKILTRVHTKRERNQKIVATKKRQFLSTHSRLFCEACGFDFENFYGMRGKGFIECHHMNPIHTLSPGAVTRLEDLILLCANCHRMIHSKRPWLTVEELKILIGNKQ